MFKHIKISLIVVVLSSFTFLASCSSMFFYPTSEHDITPNELGIIFDDIYLQSTDNLSLNAWLLKVPNDTELKGTIYFLHGNAQNISQHLGSVYWLPEQGYQVFMLDYRGYGKSAGKASFPEVFDDIKAGFNYIISTNIGKEKPIYMFGQSLGATMCGYVVGNNQQMQQQLSAVILDAGFASYQQISKHIAKESWLTWLIQYPVAWSMPTKYDLQDAIEKISPTPLLIIHGKNDKIIPYQQAQLLFERANNPKALLSYEGGHISTFSDTGNQQLLLSYLAQHK